MTMVRGVSLFVASVMLGLAAGCGPGSSIGSSDNGNPSGPGPTSIASATVVIVTGATAMGTAAYGVNPLVIQPGTVVTWINQDTMAHTATSSSGVWDSGVIDPGSSYSFTFSNPGTYPYFCTIHGAAAMSGMIEVTR